MPLKLDFKHGEKMIVNGAVMENVGSNAQLLVHNKASIMREKEILSNQEAATPASRVYFELQCAYIFRETRDEHLARFNQFLKDYIDACPSAADIGENIQRNVADGDLYKGLKATRNLISHEVKTFDAVNKGIDKLNNMADEADSDAAGGASSPSNAEA